MPDNCQLCSLPDGRQLAYALWGDPRGVPVVYCHGFPGSRLEARLGDAAARQLGIRLIAPDRPGFGASSPSPGRRLSDWPTDLGCLADTLGLDRFHLLGLSGGGPYAIACGQHLAARIPRLAIVCGLGELNGADPTTGMNLAAAAGLRFYQGLPRLAHPAYAHLIGPALGHFPDLTIRIITGLAGAADREVLDDPQVRQAISDGFGEAFRVGGDGPAQELGLFTSPWDIDVAQVRVPVQLWHGEADNTVPVAMGRRHARLLPDCDARFIPGEGHFSLIVHYMQPILADLIRPPA